MTSVRGKAVERLTFPNARIVKESRGPGGGLEQI